MSIACIGWGSLIWNPGSLNIISDWFTDGPRLPIEFARESSNQRITLVLIDSTPLVDSLWCLLGSGDLAQAKYDLAQREGVPDRYIENSIGFWERNSGKSHGKAHKVIEQWAWPRDINAVVWTNLQCGFKRSRGQIPSSAEIISHLESIPDPNSDEVFDYIKKAPEQIDTPYRSAINQKFNL